MMAVFFEITDTKASCSFLVSFSGLVVSDVKGVYTDPQSSEATAAVKT